MNLCSINVGCKIKAIDAIVGNKFRLPWPLGLPLGLFRERIMVAVCIL